MTHYDNDLLRLQKKLAHLKQQEAKLHDLKQQRKVYERQLSEASDAHDREQADVEKLEGKSLANYFYLITGKLEGKLTEERRQAAAAKVKLDAARRELDAVDNEIREIQLQLTDLYSCEYDYAAALKKKRAEVKTSGTGAAVLELEEKIAFLESQKSEIREAFSAGQAAMGAANHILSELRSADSWNTWDMLGGGGIVTHIAKHSHLDDAQNLVEVLQSNLRRFKTELADINIQANMQVNVDGFLRFADFFFDGLFADWAVGDRISQSQSSVMSVRHKIEKALNQLTELEKHTDEQIAALNGQIEDLLVNG